MRGKIKKVLSKYLKDVPMKQEDANKMVEELIDLVPGLSGAMQFKYEKMHEYLNKIMDSMVMYDKDTLKMAEAAIDRNRFCATEARTILRSMMK